MNAIIFKVFMLNLAVIGLPFLTIRRRITALSQQRNTLMICFLVTPVVLAMKGYISALYLADLLSPVLFWYAFRLYLNMPRVQKFLSASLLTILVILPLFGTLAIFFCGSQSTQFESRNMQWLGIWLLRNLIYTAVFIIATARPIELDEYISQLKAILLLAFGTAVIGIIDYAGIKDFSVCELIAAYNNPDSAYHYSTTTLGWGFLGMFRGSVGQLYANLLCLCIPFILVDKGKWWTLAVALAGMSIVIVLCSFSRAGMVACVLSAILMAFLSGMRGTKLFVFIGIALVALLPLLNMETLSERIFSIATYAGSKKINRVDGWLVALRVLSQDGILFLFGNGAGNREGVAALMGSYGAHNEYLDAIFRGGIFLLIGLLAFLTILFFIFMKKRSQSQSAVGRIWLSIGPTLLVSNMVIGITQDHLLREYSGYAVGLFMYYIYGLSAAVSPHGIEGKAA